MRRLLAAAVLLALAGCGEEGTAEPPRWVSYRDTQHGFAVRYPADWHRAEERLTPRLADPVEILSLGTHPLRAGSPRCNQYPVRAVEDMGPTDAFISIQERRDPVAGELGPRPRPFELPDAPGNMFCAPDPQRFDSWLSFGDVGRGFYLAVAVGAGASLETRRQLVEVLNSLQFEQR